MNWKRIGRAALCLLVVCCLILNMSPLRAQATAVVVPAAPVVAAVPGLNVVAAVLIGLGVLYGVATTDWDGIVNSCAEWLTEQGMIDDSGRCNIIKFPDPNGGLPSWFADLALIEMIHQWLYDEQVVTETAGQEGYAYYNGVLLPVIPEHDSVYQYYLIRGDISTSSFTLYTLQTIPYVKVSSGRDLVYIGSSDKLFVFYIYTEGSWHNYGHSYGSFFADTSPFIWSSVDLLFDDGSLFLSGSDSVPAGSSIDTAYDVSLGEVASSDTAIADGYTTWAENATTVTGSTIGGSDDEEVIVFPLGLGQTWEDTRELTQEDVWAGTSTYEDTSAPAFTTDLNTDLVTYEQGALASPLVVAVSAPSDCYLSYAWYVSVDGAEEELVEGAIAPKYTPLTDVLGTYAYRCHVTVADAPAVVADLWSQTATIEIVVPGSISVPDGDSVTQTGLKGLLGNLLSSITQLFNNLQNAISNFFDSAVAGILEGIKEIFVPSEDFITEKVQALRAEFGFADSIMSTGEAIGAALNDFDTSPPIIYMELGNAESQYNWGGRAVALDLRWYERYKPTVDQLLSALLYLWFAWRVFRRLPGIISGVDGDIPDVSVHDGAFRGYASSLLRLGSGSMKRRD